MRRFAFVLTLVVCGQAQAASLRNVTTLHGPMVYLRDLFDDSGSNSDRVLGPGPEPGGRIIVEAAQLNAIAKQFGVAWRSVSRADRAVLEWPGHPLRKDEATEAVRLAITAAGASDEIDIDLAGFNPPIVPTEMVTASFVSQLEFDANTGRFTALLSITGEGMNPIDTRISGRVEEMTDTLVAATRLLPETVLRGEDVRTARVRLTALQGDPARSLEQIVGMQLARPIAAGQPLRLADLIRPALVQRGSTVKIELSSAGLSVTGQAVALDSGADGDKIRVQNLSSKAFLYAEVVGPGQVRITPGAAPALPTAPARFDRRRLQ